MGTQTVASITSLFFLYLALTLGHPAQTDHRKLTQLVKYSLNPNYQAR